MKLLVITLCIVALFSVAKSQTVKFNDCGSKVGKISKVEVFPCTEFPCKLHHGKSYTINVTFTINESANQTKAKVYGIIDGIKVPFPIDQPDGCKGGLSGLKCPLKAGGTYRYTATLPIKSIYPDVKVVVQWSLLDANTGGNTIFCFQTFVAIVP